MIVASRIWAALAALFRWRRAECPALPAPAEARDDVHDGEREARVQGALRLLCVLQQARFLDLLEIDLSEFRDEEIAGAARLLLPTIRSSLRQYVTLERVRREPEGTRVTVDVAAPEVRLTGHVRGEGPWTGRLAHAGYRATKIELPELERDARLIAPAELELEK